MVYYLLSLEARNFIISGCNATLREKIDDTLTFPTPYYFHFISFAFVQLTYLPLPSEKEMFHDVIVILLTWRYIQATLTVEGGSCQWSNGISGKDRSVILHITIRILQTWFVK